MNPAVLTFKDGKFRFIEVSTPKLRLALSKNAAWTDLGDDSYETLSLGAAAAQRRFGDSKVERIFQRTFQAHYALPNLPPLPVLDPHQKAGLRWVLERKRSYLAHAPGAGKTAQAILAAHFAEGPGQSVFLVPPGLVTNWQREILKVTSWLDIWPSMGIVRGSDEKENVAWRADFLIIPDSMITKDWVYTRLSSLKIKLLAVDEASRFKDPQATRSLALYGGSDGEKHFRGLIKDARHVVFLDGSPMPNRPIELWAPAYALHPESIDCRSYDDFGYRYCGARPNERGVWEYKYSSNEEELKEKLQKDFMHVVTEKELPHPERRRSMLFLDRDLRSPEQKTWERKHLSELQISENGILGDAARFRKELGIRKVPWVASYVRWRLEEKNESILVFAWHREVCVELAKSIATGDRHLPGIIYGGTSPVLREKFFADFQSGKDKCLILNIAAGGRGHNLQKADRVIFAEWSWSDEANRQCEHRAARRGSDKAFVRCEYLVSPGSMDEVVLSSLFTKRRRVEKVIG